VRFAVKKAASTTKKAPASAPAAGKLHCQIDAAARLRARPARRASFIGLAKIYQEHPDFRARHEGRAAGLTDYMAKAINAFAELELSQGSLC
jgi:hypothetical protein